MSVPRLDLLSMGRSPTVSNGGTTSARKPSSAHSHGALSHGALGQEIHDMVGVNPAAIDDVGVLRGRLTECQRLLVSLERHYDQELERKERRVAEHVARLTAALQDTAPEGSPAGMATHRSWGTQAVLTGRAVGTTPRHVGAIATPSSSLGASASPRPYYPSTPGAAVRHYTRSVQAVPMGHPSNPQSHATTPRSPPASARGHWAQPQFGRPATASTPRAMVSGGFAGAVPPVPAVPTQGRGSTTASASHSGRPRGASAAWSPQPVHQYKPATRRGTTPRS